MKLPEGVTQRQAQYWIANGYVLPPDGGSRAPGTGYHRKLTDEDMAVIALIARLRRVGIEVGLASRLARKHVHEGAQSIDLGDGITVRFHPEHRYTMLNYRAPD